MKKFVSLQRVIKSLIRQSDLVEVFSEEVVLFSKSISCRMKHLQAVIELNALNGLKAKFSKCQLAKRSTPLMGHIADKESDLVKWSQVKVIQETSRSTSRMKVDRFLWIVGYYRRFFRYCANISALLHASASTKKTFRKTEEMGKVFRDLKAALASSSVSALSNFQYLFVVDVDAFFFALGAVLHRRRDMTEFIW